MAVRRIFDKGGFLSAFDDKNGDYVRTGILDKAKNDTNIEPFSAEFPQLLDIGIMGHCLHGLSGLCEKCGTECYQSGKSINEPNILFEDYEGIIKQCADRTFQVALGGRGDPDQHESFEDILCVTRHYGIVPNITTSGYGLSNNLVKIIAKYCGAAAVSWYKTPYTYKAIDMLLDFGVTTNIHFVLGKNSIDEAINLLSGNMIEGIEKIIFLLHKPVGMGGHDRVLTADDERVGQFLRLLVLPNIAERVGFDSCLVPAIATHCPDIAPESYDACEAGRFSAYIGADMMMCPCSFDKTKNTSESLINNTVENVWNGEKFNKFRSVFKEKCAHCDLYERCLGGCPISPIIRLCGRTEGNYNEN